MQIADILNSGEHDADAVDSSHACADNHQYRCGSKRWKRRGRVADIIQNSVCLAPRLLISRLMSSARKLSGRSLTKNRGVERESKRGRSLGSVVTGEREDDDMLNSSGKAQVDCENLEDAGDNRTITYFNMAIGIWLLHLIVSSKKEFSEMAKLRKKYELVVQNAKERFQSKDSSMFSLLSESNDIVTHQSCTVDAKEITTIGNDKLIGNPLYSKSMRLSDQSLTSTQTVEENCVGRMGQLETEMEFELERLQHLLDKEDSSDHLNQQKTQILFEDFSSEASNTTTSFRQSNDHPNAMSTSWGVNPIELDMKLHELLEMRQEERIKELEIALSNTRQTLYEKEQELCLWKDTARIMHQEHVP